MPKLPGVPSVRQAPLGAPKVGANPSGVLGEDIAQGLQRLGGGVDQAGDQLHALYRQEKQKADTTLATTGLTALQDDTITSMDDASTGFVPTARGMEAAKRSGSVYERFNKKREELAGQLQNDEQRLMFGQHADQMWLHLRERVNGHVAQQNNVAEAASVNGLAETTLTAIANDYRNDGFAADQGLMVEARLRKSAVTPEEAEAKAMKWRAQVAKVRLNQFKGADDLDGMQSLFSRVKEQLGPDTEQYQAQLTLMTQRKAADRTALGVINAHRQPNTFINEATARATFEALPEHERTKEAEAAFNGWMAQEKARENDVKGQYFERALGAFNERHRLRDIDPDDAQWIQKNDSPKWEALQNREQSWIDHRRAGRQGGVPKSKSQIALYGEMLRSIASEPDTYATMPMAAFVGKWGPGLADDDLERGVVQVAALAKAHGDKSGPPSAIAPLAVAKDVFRQQLELTGKGSGDEANWTPLQNTMFAKVVDHVSEQEKAWRKANPTKAPTVEQLQGWAQEKLVEGTVPGGGFIFSGDETMTRAQFEADPQNAGKTFIEKGLPDPAALPDDGLIAARRIFKAKGMDGSTQNYRDLFSAVLPELRRALGREPTMVELSAYLRRMAPPDDTVPPYLKRAGAPAVVPAPKDLNDPVPPVDPYRFERGLPQDEGN